MSGVIVMDLLKFLEKRSIFKEHEFQIACKTEY